MTTTTTDTDRDRSIQFTINIRCDNDAFDPEEPHDEVARILRSLADRLEAREGLAAGLGNDIPLRDVNGNFVGVAFFGIESL